MEKENYINNKSSLDNLTILLDELKVKQENEDPRETSIAGLDFILIRLNKIKFLFNTIKNSHFVEAIDLIEKLVKEIMDENIGFFTGLSYFFSLYEMFLENLEDYTKGKKPNSNFEKAVLNLKKIIKGEKTDTQALINIKTPLKKEKVIQTISKEIIETGIIPDFINDSEEALTTAEKSLLNFEKSPIEREHIDPIFRSFHSIKGSAGFLKLVEINSLSHITEDILSLIRDKKIPPTKKIFNALFKSIDILRKLLAQVSNIINEIKPDPINMQEGYNILTTCIHPSNDSDFNTMQEKDLGSKTESRDLINKTNRSSEMVKVQANKLDELSELVGEMVVALSLLSQNSTLLKAVDRKVNESIDHIGKITENLYDKILGLRMFPVESIFSKLYIQIRELSQKSGKKINLLIEGGDTLVDKVIIDSIYTPLTHLIRNAVDHGIEEKKERLAAGKKESANITLSATHKGDSIIIKVKDDGKGIDPDVILAKAIDKGFIKKKEKVSEKEILSTLFKAGFSTAKSVTDISGRGVGMDVVKRAVEELRGKISIQNFPSKGCTFSIELPLNTSIIEGLVVRIGNNRFVIPILSVIFTVTPKKENLSGAYGKNEDFFILSDETIPIIRLYKFYSITPDKTDPSNSIIIVVSKEKKKYGLMVDELLFRQQVVIKNLGDRFSKLKGITGGTILGNGRLGLILEPQNLLRSIYSQS